jgi:dihydroflavonol-4-reductase
MKTAFVTGATGFLGRNLIDVLVKDGWTITCMHRPTSNIAPLQRPGISLVVADFDDPASLRAAIPERVDAVFHMAGNTAMWRRRNAEQTHDNVDATRAIIDAALARHARRFAFTSSIASYSAGTAGDGEIGEDTPQKGGDAWINYERSKYLAERVVFDAVASRGLDAVVINPGHIVGKYDTRNWCQMIAMVQNDSLPGIPPGFGPFGSAHEVAKAHVRAIELGAPGERFLLGGVHETFATFVATIGEVLGKSPKARTMPAFVLKTMGRLQVMFGAFSRKEPALTPEKAAIICQRLHITSDKAERKLGYRAVPLRDLVQETVDWMRSQGSLPAESLAA